MSQSISFLTHRNPLEKVLSGKTILITGGTSGLGQAFVRQALAARGRVCFTYYQNNASAQVLQKLGAEGFVLDLADIRAIDEFVTSFKKKIGDLDILVHNAAAVRDHTIQNLTEEDWDYVMNVDLKAPYYLTKKLLPLFLKKRESCRKIFMIISRVALTGAFGTSNYAAAKAGLIGLAKSLALELGKRNILVNAVNPGFMKSRMTADLPEEAIKKNLELSPLDRFSDPDEVARFLVYLSSDSVTQLTGQLLHFESRKV